MRIAVALPSLPRGSLHRAALDAAIAALARRGHDVEAFAEAGRTREPEEFPVFHYLRMRERHAEVPFEVALYPLGRDTPPYEPAYVLMHQFPGVVWVLDPVLHHLLLGGIAIRGRWDAYQRLRETILGDATPIATAVVAAGWGVRSLYQRSDPMRGILRHQRRICAATPFLGRELMPEHEGVVTVPLPAVPEGAQAVRSRGSGASRAVLVLAFNYAWPEPAFRALAELIRRHEDLVVRLVVPELLQPPLAARAARVGLEERVEWLLSPDWPRLREEQERATSVLHLRDDPTVGEQALLLAALGAGLPVAVLRVGAQEHLPEGAVLKVEPGRSLTGSLVGMLDGALGDPALSTALAAGGRRHAAALPGPDDVAVQLEDLLRASAATSLVEEPLSRPVWQALAQRLEAVCVPAGADPGMRAWLRERLSDLSDHLPAAAERPEGQA